MRLRRNSLVLLVAGALVALGGCAGLRKPAPVEPPTLKSLASRKVEVNQEQLVVADDQKAAAAYRDFLKAAPRDRQRPEAMRRLGDLAMDGVDAQAAASSGDYRAAIALYQDYLKAYPDDPGNDRVLYQMARAYELDGDQDTALKTLTRLVQRYPATRYRDEAQFRRGELLFTMREYTTAEQAYASVLQGATPTPYHERALYMQGWSLFKLARLDDALTAFFGVLDLKLIGKEGVNEGGLDTLPLTRADRELVEDTFRVASLCLENLQGAETIPIVVGKGPAGRRDYEYRVYEQLGELYLKQERIKDAADTFAGFARRNPLQPQAPVAQARVIEIYQQGGFAMLALEAKKSYVAQYGNRSELRRTHPAAWERAQPLVKVHLTELARNAHAAAQKSHKPEDVQEAVRWYRAFLESYPADPQAAQNNFLLAELLFEDRRFDDAAAEYERTAYQYPQHARSADAGYAALLAYAEREKSAAPAEQKALKLAEVDSAMRFARGFPTDPRTGAVLTRAAEQLYALQMPDRATEVAQQVLALDPPAAPAQRRVAATVIAHAAFEKGAFDRAEKGYGEALALTPERDAARNDLSERLAASIYKQGEQARDAGRLADAVGHFDRVAAAAPQSAVRVTAQYDAAAALIGLKDWDGAARQLEDFRQRYPNHPLRNDVSSKLAVAYMEKGRWAQAAAELEILAATQKDPQLARGALWQAAEMHEKAGASASAGKAYERYLKQYREPLENAVEARFRLAGLAHREGNPTRELAWMKDVLAADQTAGAARTDRTRYLGGMAALALAEPARDAYRKVPLVEPLQKQLKLKKAKMEEVLKAYGAAAEYGVAEVATAATYQTAELYRDFGRALIGSQRPKGLSKAEVEQYTVMLEEQAYPFEEKAIALHEANARRSASGIYDRWVRDSYVALGELRPVRYGKSERSEGVIDAIR